MRAVNAAFTIAHMFAHWPSNPPSGRGGVMETRNSQAGGFWLILAIIIGTAIGVWRGQPSIGVLAGTGVGVLLALGIYLRDRARS